MDAPGGNEPDCFISQVHSASTVVAGVNWGKALATTVPQVNSLVPYSSTTEVMGTLLSIVALKVMLSGKLSVG